MKKIQNECSTFDGKSLVKQTWEGKKKRTLKWLLVTWVSMV
jgi:hypothetical protein